MSKGSRPRPYSVSQEKFSSNYDQIFRKTPKVEPTLCACMGPQGNDPHCPCTMEQMGLPHSGNMSDEERQQLTNAINKHLNKESK
jgi:hypothetical protein